MDKDSLPGVLSNLTAGRIANRFGFGGPNFVTDAAARHRPPRFKWGCGRSMPGPGDVAPIVGGVDTYGGPFMYLSFQQEPKHFSESGHCTTFDVNADGTVSARHGFYHAETIGRCASVGTGFMRE